MIIEDYLKKRKEIVYGARAMNVQLPITHNRLTEDYDVYSKKPRRSARKLERKLDKAAQGDCYYTKPAMHPGTFKVMDKGPDRKRETEDDFNVADFTIPNRRIKFKTIGGIRYAALSERKKDAKRALKEPEFAFRHHKDRRDLYMIKTGKRITRWF